MYAIVARSTSKHLMKNKKKYSSIFQWHTFKVVSKLRNVNKSIPSKIVKSQYTRKKKK